MDNNRLSKNEDEEEVEYMGNIWGWKFSFISLGVLIVLISWLAIRSCTANPSDLTTTQTESND